MSILYEVFVTSKIIYLSYFTFHIVLFQTNNDFKKYYEFSHFTTHMGDLVAVMTLGHISYIMRVIYFGLQITFICLNITPSHYHHCVKLSEDTELIKCLSDIFRAAQSGGLGGLVRRRPILTGRKNGFKIRPNRLSSQQDWPTSQTTHI